MNKKAHAPPPCFLPDGLLQAYLMQRKVFLVMIQLKGLTWHELLGE